MDELKFALSKAEKELKTSQKEGEKLRERIFELEKSQMEFAERIADYGGIIGQLKEQTSKLEGEKIQQVFFVVFWTVL